MQTLDDLLVEYASHLTRGAPSGLTVFDGVAELGFTPDVNFSLRKSGQERKLLRNAEIGKAIMLSFVRGKLDDDQAWLDYRTFIGYLKADDGYKIQHVVEMRYPEHSMSRKKGEHQKKNVSAATSWIYRCKSKIVFELQRVRIVTSTDTLEPEYKATRGNEIYG